MAAPLLVTKESGLQDDLSGVERKVAFDVLKDGKELEIVQSLAKWKRFALDKYGFATHKGLYTDMTAIRRDDKMDETHSIYVEQWVWEKVITSNDRSLDYLKSTVRKIVKAVKETSELVKTKGFDGVEICEDVYFITSQELLDMYPTLSAKEREYNITKEKGAVFIMQIGDTLSNGEKHDGRAPDYDDWKLNGDILVYYPVLDIALELSSMGIRVDEDSIQEQLKKAGCEERANLPFQKAIINKELPYTIGGGIGQSRICMFFLRKAHIGEVQCSIWPEEIRKEAKENQITLL